MRADDGDAATVSGGGTLGVQADMDGVGLENLFGMRMPTYLKRRYYGNLWSYGMIADELGISEATVARWMRQLGFSLRQVAYEAMSDDPALRTKLTVVKARKDREDPRLRVAARR